MPVFVQLQRIATAKKRCLAKSQSARKSQMEAAKID
jgi:hypothetical protein